MKQQLETLSRLARLRASRVREVLGRIQYQQNLCQRYRNNIEGLARLCSYEAPLGTSLQRDNYQRYKGTLYKMMELQRRELAVAEGTLARIQQELLQAMRSEKVVTHLIETKFSQWQELLARQEQKLQDAMAAQAWWRHRLS